MVSSLTSSLTTSSLSGRTPCAPSIFLLLPFVFGVLPAGATTTPPQVVPPGTGRVLPPAPSAIGRLPHVPPQRSNCLRSEAPALAQHSWVFKPPTRQTLRKLSRPILFVGHVCVQSSKVQVPKSSSSKVRVPKFEFQSSTSQKSSSRVQKVQVAKFQFQSSGSQVTVPEVEFQGSSSRDEVSEVKFQR